MLKWLFGPFRSSINLAVATVLFVETSEDHSSALPNPKSCLHYILLQQFHAIYIRFPRPPCPDAQFSLSSSNIHLRLSSSTTFLLFRYSLRTMVLGSTQPLTEMSTRDISWGKGGRCVRLTTLPPSFAVVMKSGNLNFLETSGPLQACNRTALPLPSPYSLLNVPVCLSVCPQIYNFVLPLVPPPYPPSFSTPSIHHIVYSIIHLLVLLLFLLTSPHASPLLLHLSLHSTFPVSASSINAAQR